MAGMTTEPARTFLRLAALGAFLYVAAQVFQWLVIAFGSPAAPSSPEAAVLNRLSPLAQARAFAVMASFPAVLLAYVGVAVYLLRRAPGAAITGLVFASIFVALELAYRSIDFFVVTQDWAYRLQESTDASVTASIVDRSAGWRAIVEATYFPLLLSNALASIALAAGVWGVADRSSRVLAVLLVLKALQGTGRILEIHAGIADLSTFNFRIYFPIAIAAYGFMGIWLWMHSVEKRPASVDLARAPTR